MTDDEEPRGHRIVLVLDINGLTRVRAEQLARACLRALQTYLADRSIDATPIRYDFDGWTHLAPDPGS